MTHQRKQRCCSLPPAFSLWGAAALCAAVTTACSGSFETQDTDRAPRDPVAVAAVTPAAVTPAPAAPARMAAAAPPVTAAANDEDEDELPADDSDTPVVAAAGKLSFESDVWPIFSSQCGPCHVSLNSGGQNIGGADVDAALKDAVTFEDKVLSEITSGDMPLGCSGGPGESGCVSEDNFDLIQRWYDEGSAP